MKKILMTLAALFVLSTPALAQSTFVPQGNKLWVNASANHAAQIVVSYRIRQVNQGQATATVKAYEVGKPATTSATDLRFYVCDPMAKACLAAPNVFKLTDALCNGVPPVKYGFVVDVVLTSGAVVTGPLSAKGIDCGVVSASSIQDVYLSQ